MKRTPSKYLTPTSSKKAVIRRGSRSAQRNNWQRFSDALQARAAGAIGSKISPMAGKLASYVVRKGLENRRRVRKDEGTDHPSQYSGSVDSCNVSYKMPYSDRKKKIKGFIKSTYQNYASYQNSLDISAGLQTVEEHAFILTRDCVINSSGISYSNSQLPIGLFNTIPDQMGTNNQASSRYNGLTTTVIDHDKLYMRNVVLRTDIYNSANIPVFVDVYACVSKNSRAVGPVVDWTYDQEPYFSSLAYASNTGIAGAAINGTSGSLSRTLYNVKPTNCLRFKQHWKIIDCKSFPMAPNAYQHINFNLDYHRVLKKYIWSSENDTCIKDFTVCFMIVAKGSVVNVVGNTGSSMDTTNVTTGSGKVIVNSTVHYYYSPLIAPPNRNQPINIGYSVIPTNRSAANQTTGNQQTNTSQTTTTF